MTRAAHDSSSAFCYNRDKVVETFDNALNSITEKDLTDEVIYIPYAQCLE